MKRALRALGLLLACAPPSTVATAQSAPFDLAGPALKVKVQRQGATLPISHVPNLTAGDRLSIQADLPTDQSAHYLLLAVFLRGATNPPPKEWFYRAETWKPKDKDRTLSITVPEGAHQLVLFLAPETGGAFSTLLDAVRGRPGAFVRAAQDLNQAMLDRTRLDAFLDGIRRQDAAQSAKLDEVSPVLAHSLAVKLNADCLQKTPDLQAACLTQDREALVLNDVHSTTMTEALTGAPADLALQVAATPQGGMGYYSPYIGVVRDLARVLGAFHTAQYQYIPGLAITRGDTISLLLNAVPSFREPMSVLVTALPPIAPPHIPPLQETADAPALCAARPNLILPVSGGPLIYSTNFAHSMALAVRTKDGRALNVPVTARADKGGFVLDGGRLPLADFGERIDGTLHGYWGFQSFDGPRFQLANSVAMTPRVAGSPTLTEGLDAKLELENTAGACVEGVTARYPSGDARAVTWQPAGADRIAVALPGKGMGPGTAAILVKYAGVSEPAQLSLTIEPVAPPPPPPMVAPPEPAPAAAPPAQTPSS